MREATPRTATEEDNDKVYLCTYSSRKNFSQEIIKSTKVITQRGKRLESRGNATSHNHTQHLEESVQEACKFVSSAVMMHWSHCI